MKINLILYFSYFILLLKQLKCYIVYPLKYLDEGSNDFQSLLSFNSTYTILEIGTPPQKVNFFLNISHIQINLTDKGCINKNLFNKTASTSFEKKFELDPSEQDENTKYLVIDVLYFNKYLNLTEKLKIPEYPFYYSSNISENDIDLCGNIGLSLVQYGKYDFESDKVKEYTNKLKELGAGKYTDFSFYYYNNQDFLILNRFLNTELPDLFKDTEIAWTHPLFRPNGYTLYWEISMKEIYYNNVHSKQGIRCEFNPLFELILGTNDFKNNITNDFFKIFIDKNICSMEVYKDYHVFECNEELFTNNDIHKFPIIYFSNIETHYNFKLKSEELFIKLNNKWYFKIVFPINDLEVERWILGRIFMRKYPIQFSPFIRMIGFYLKSEEAEQEQKEEKEEKGNNANEDFNNNNNTTTGNKNIIIYIVIIIVAIIFTGLGLFLGKKLFYQRKKRANELLDDNYQYNSEFDKNIKKDDNNEKITDNQIN